MDAPLRGVLDELRGDWDRYLADLADGSAVRAFIQESWQRCRAAGLDPERTRLHRVPEADLERRLSTHRELLEVAQPHLDWVSASLVGMRFVLYLTDSEGIVLHSTGTDPELQRDAGLSLGYDWSEARMGTNGAGTALVTGHPVAIVGPEHFVRDFNGCTCTGAPIRSADGAILGALDLTTPNLPGVPGRLALVAYAARMIGNELGARRAAAERASEEWLQLAMAAGAFGAWELDLAAGTVRWDERAQQIFGRQLHGPIPLEDAAAVIHPDDRTAAEEAAAAALEPGGSGVYVAEKRIVWPDGSVRWASTRGRVLFEGEGEERQAVRLLGTVMDVTERKRAEQALHESEARFRFLADLIPQLVWSTRPDGYHDYYNRRWFEYTGLTYEDTKGTGWNAVLHPDDQERAWRRWRHSLETGEPYSIEYRFRRHDGAYRWFLGLALPLQGESGEIERWFGTCTDIQELKDTEAALRESEERLHAALDASATGTFRWEMRTNALEWDRELDRLFGLPAGETPRSMDGFLALVHPDDRRSVIGAVERCRTEGADFREEFRVVWPDGSVRWLLDQGCTYADEAGAPLYMTGACVDITERKVAEREREDLLASALAARAEAEAASRLKTEFLANMSHEIRTPINAVLGYADLLDLGIDGPLGPTQLRHVRRIRSSAQHLLTLINDVLDLAKVEAGEMQVTRERVEIRSAVLRALEIIEPLIAEHDLTLADDTAVHAGVEVWGDEDRIRQVLVNLLSNALKFTDPGGEIRLRCRVAGHPPEGVHSAWTGRWLGLEVEDTGIGIAPEVQERIFAAFSQAESGHTRRRGGTGLGLAISRTLAWLMGGDLTVQSSPGQGSRFSLWLPALEPEGAERASEARSGGD